MVFWSQSEICSVFKLTRLLVGDGSIVKPGSTLAEMEAMKIVVPIVSPCDGCVQYSTRLLSAGAAASPSGVLSSVIDLRRGESLFTVIPVYDFNVDDVANSSPLSATFPRKGIYFLSTYHDFGLRFVIFPSWTHLYPFFFIL